VPHARALARLASAEGVGVKRRDETRRAGGAVRTDGREVLRGGSIFLLLMTP
jgi:hypothetical protein